MFRAIPGGLALRPDRRPEAPAVAVELRHVSKAFGRGSAATRVLKDINLSVTQGEFVCIVGASGCGKSTLLSMIAGLDEPSGGSIDVPGERPALMFQDATLLPWLTAEQNVALPLKLAGVERRGREIEVNQLLRMVHLEHVGHRRPHELSGGMRQRVALARALAQHSDVLLMDEPFAALDAITRDRLHEELTEIWSNTGMSVIFVTHNVREAVRLGDRIILMKAHPGRMAREWSVDITRPRMIETPEVGQMALEITAELRVEMAHNQAADGDEL